MSKADWKENNVMKIFGDLMPKDIESVLDLGCGLSLKSKYIPAQVRIGVDIYDKYFKYIESDVPYTVLKHDIRKIRELFPPKSCDVVILMDVIEHLTKREGRFLLMQCERIARRAVIIETPEGYIPQDMDITGHGGHKYQTHRSGWEVEEFETRGYKVLKRPYTMDPVRRNTADSTEDTKVNLNIVMLDAIKCLKY